MKKAINNNYYPLTPTVAILVHVRLVVIFDIWAL